jgi:hypothetical protein
MGTNLVFKHRQRADRTIYEIITVGYTIKIIGKYVL